MLNTVFECIQTTTFARLNVIFVSIDTTTFGGDRCETEADQCTALADGHCNNGQCHDLVEDFKCLCMEGFTGDM